MWLGASLGLCLSWAQSPPAGGAPGFLDVEGHSGDTGDSMPSSVSPEGEASRALESAGASVGNPIPGATFLPALHCCRIFVIVVWGQAVRATWPVPFLSRLHLSYPSGREAGAGVCARPPPAGRLALTARGLGQRSWGPRLLAAHGSFPPAASLSLPPHSGAPCSRARKVTALMEENLVEPASEPRASAWSGRGRSWWPRGALSGLGGPGCDGVGLARGSQTA